MPVGYYGFEPLIQSTNQVVAQKDYTGQALAQLGGQIKQSLSDQAMRVEAAQAAPLLQHQFEQGFGQIQSGNLAGGLGQIYGASAQYAANPLLSQYAQQAQQGAGLLAHGIVQGQLLGTRLAGQQVMQGDRLTAQADMQGQRLDAQSQMNTDRIQGQATRQQAGFGQQDKHDQTLQSGLDERQSLKIKAQADRLQSILDNKNSLQEDKQQAQVQLAVLNSQLKMNTADPMVPIQRAMAVQKSYHDQIGKLQQERDAAESAGNIPAWNDAQAQINKVNSVMLRMGGSGKDLDGNPMISQADKAKLAELKEKLANVPGSWTLSDKKKLADDYQSQINAITDRANEGIQKQAEAAKTMSQESQQPQFTEGQIVKQNGQAYKYTNGNFEPVQ
jgi:hypothetical protein